MLKCKLQTLKQRLQIWSKENFGDLGNKVKQIEQKLNDMENALPVQPSDQQIQELKKTQADLWEKATIHEACLRQKSRSRWIKEGDNNTSYFHRSIKYSRRRNAVRGLLIDGSWVENPTMIKAEVKHHFQSRFSEPNLLRPNLDGVAFSVLHPTQRS